MDITQKLKNFFTLRHIIGIAGGALAGFLYYYFIGCSSGTCPITSNPAVTIIYGALAGGVLFYKGKKSADSGNTNQKCCM